MTAAQPGDGDGPARGRDPGGSGAAAPRSRRRAGGDTGARPRRRWRCRPRWTSPCWPGELPARGITVARFEQPWRLAGRKVAVPPPQLDDRLAPAVAALAGRAAARRTCRCSPAGAVPVRGWPAGPRPDCPVRGGRLPGLPAAPARPARAVAVAELLTPSVPRLVLQGTSDTFGTAAELTADWPPADGGDRSSLVRAAGRRPRVQDRSARADRSARRTCGASCSRVRRSSSTAVTVGAEGGNSGVVRVDITMTEPSVSRPMRRRTDVPTPVRSYVMTIPTRAPPPRESRRGLHRLVDDAATRPPKSDTPASRPRRSPTSTSCTRRPCG